MSNTVLVTGASSGLGRATAKKFHGKGWNVVATMRAPEQETELQRLDHVLVTRLDVQDHESIEGAVGAALQTFGRIDAVVNNAGYGVFGPLEATPIETIRRQFEVNVIGMIATTKAVLPHYRANRRGVIVNVSSIGGRMAFPLGTAYHGSKFAVEGLSEALHYELGALGVRVKVVEPGGMKTDFGGRSLDFNHDPTLVAYEPLVQSVHKVLGPLMENGSDPAAVAEVIYGAATDGSDRLRYEAGADALEVLAARRGADDAAFMAGIRTQFGISP
ncbi:MAG: SDR family oxidoreductase [Pseudomonadota bacterium]|nr:SDR family oxidoreductase [Pseudomonadota bacterium]